ncbi:hypothetical protein N7456_006701 [Penicillium angulare]|uniref:Tetratricopeptide repeat protein n=1 Tax=Penicillium angulare TaxID=116970 RepID=A0A9W9KBY0_9EURO|nr:hypothetical protein N7456_006701 [Penicillium angulare]
MNVCDVSNHPRHARLLKKAKEEQQAADRRKGQPIQMTKSRLEVIDQLHEEKFEEAVFLNKADSEPSLATMVNISTPYLPSVAPLEDLRKIFLRALKHETHHRGDYMLLRVASAFIVEGTTYFIAEDENEDVIKVHIHYCNRKFMRTYMAQKGVFILKEPFLKSLSEDNYAIQIHHLSDLISIPPTDPILPSSWRRELLPQGSDAVAWAALGDEHYHSGELYHAQDCYEEAFRHNPTEEVADNLRSHMAQVLLIRGNYYAALEELNDVIEPGVKELWLKWEAQYKAREFRKASATFTTISRDHLEGIMDDQTRNQYARTIQRVAERDHAKYKFGEMQMSARNLEELSECASYVRFIRLGYLSATQRPGLFAEKEFQAGDLIFCEKAFRYRNDEVEGSIWMTVNAETNSITVGTQPNLVRKIAEQMYNNPPVIGSICALYSADFKTVDPLQVVNGRQVVDS